MKKNIFIHESAIVDFPVTIGQGTKIWHFSHINKNAEIGENCVVGQNVYIASNVKIGNGVKIQNNISIYDEVIIEDNVFCGPSVVFTNVYNPRSEINRKSEYLKTLVREGTTLGANSTIICGIKLGRYSFIGAGALVNRDVKDFELVVGNPIRQIGWVNSLGNKIPKIPLVGNGIYKCDESNEMFKLDGEYLEKIK